MLPGITINGTRYTFDNSITVDSFSTRNWSIIANLGYFLGAISAIFVIFANYKKRKLSTSKGEPIDVLSFESEMEQEIRTIFVDTKTIIKTTFRIISNSIPRYIKISVGILLISIGIIYILFPETIGIGTLILINWNIIFYIPLIVTGGCILILDLRESNLIWWWIGILILMAIITLSIHYFIQ
jgi:hypothetical protein